MKRAEFDPTDIFVALNDAKVRYLVVGGIAAILHGVDRFTWDVDLSVELTTANLTRLADALEPIGFERRVPAPVLGLADPKTRRLWVQQRNMKVYSFIERKAPTRVIDVMVTPLRNFDQVYRRRTMIRSGSVSIPLVPVDILVELKRAAGRPEDLFDIKALKELGRVT